MKQKIDNCIDVDPDPKTATELPQGQARPSQDRSGFALMCQSLFCDMAMDLPGTEVLRGIITLNTASSTYKLPKNYIQSFIIDCARHFKYATLT